MNPTRAISNGIRSMSASWLIAGWGLVASGCMGPDVDPEVDVDTGTTHALITVDYRVTNAGEEGSDKEIQAAALAGFARIPLGVDAQAVLTLAGWNLELPQPGSCLALSADRDQNTPLAPIERVELLEVGDVVVSAGGDETLLAPRAFAGGDVLTGVLYTSRDLNAEPFPPGESYTIQTSGGALPPLELEADAPAALSNVTLGGVTLNDANTVALGDPLDITWAVGATGDVLYVELVSGDGLNATRCAFRDEDGAGTIPEGSFAAAGDGSLSVHRLRTLPIEGNGIQGELRFDIEQLVNVVFEG